MRAEDRKAAVAAYKERKIISGIYLIRCTVSGEAWIGACAELSTIQNRIWFMLRFGNHPNKALQLCWDEHGAEAFSFEALERLEEDDPYIRTARLKERAAHWREWHKAGRL
ncbi:hypothetical protein SAMN05216304_103712 [Bosea sp. OK403]|uniref:GIY-YIG nuclease family protein n=1 Tax=Bosea sp. OK403 TaxID=1855286 RepID=UPI0008EE9AEE|nr:GIY-YIG nuclease family protein [Bosea sp. OK403]SFI84057.1 hypothetical protein SAMN05216304_103712 [Bosea sp. OK403]